MILVKKIISVLLAVSVIVSSVETLNLGVVQETDALKVWKIIIERIILSIEPHSEVLRDTDVILRCEPKVDKYGQELTGEFTIYKDSKPLYTKISNVTEDVLFSLPDARVSNTGSYICGLKVQGEEKMSMEQKLTVTGLAKPVLQLDKSLVMEQEKITVTCTAPGETGDITFRFYDNGTEIAVGRNSNKSEVKKALKGKGFHQIHCDYEVKSLKSNQSNSVMVQVKELPFTLVMEITPKSGINVGDPFFISCTVSNSSEDPYLNSQEPMLSLYQGKRKLAKGATELTHRMVAQTSGPQKFECDFTIGYVELETLETLVVSGRPPSDSTPWQVITGIFIGAISIIIIAVIWWCYKKCRGARASSNPPAEQSVSSIELSSSDHIF